MKQMDYFERLGIERDPRPCPVQLEKAYLQKSKETHPDLLRNNGDWKEEDQDLHLQASASLNKAYQVLSRPWERFAYLVELLSPGVLERTKKLSPAFLLEAMEMGEAISDARGNPNLERKLATDLQEKIVKTRERIADLLKNPENAEEAATLLHKSKYLRRSLETLQRKEDQAPL
jgi:molecular chaperone HscB